MYITIQVTAKDVREAKKIAKVLLEKNLIACANIVNDIQSVYRWEGKIKEDKEVLMILKTKKNFFKRIIEVVKSVHSYDVPEIIAIPIVDSNNEYLQWINESTRLSSKG